MTAQVLRDAALSFDTTVPVVIIGAGAAGLVAALAAAEAGVVPLLVERDAVPRGSTALSAGLIPAAGTRWQRAHGIADTPALLAHDLMTKSHGKAARPLVERVAGEAGPTIEWLADCYGLPFSLVHDFNYPGHSVRRMHGLPSRSGAELVDRLRAATEARDIPLLTNCRVTTLVADDDGRVRGVIGRRPDSTEERIGCGALILACSGYGANRALVAKHIPEMAGALYFGHPGNEGDAVSWGAELGAALADMAGHQGHGSVAHPHGILITWAVMTEGGFQVNAEGLRFSDETLGYSEQAALVLSQPGGIAFDIFDARIAAIARQFEDFRLAEQQGAVITADDPAALARSLEVPVDPFLATFTQASDLARDDGIDAFGRNWLATVPLAEPLHGVKVTGALFHTQGGLVVDGAARVLRPDGSALPSLHAAGGAACGVSGPDAAGYLSGNGLLTAVTLGRIAGREATRVGSR